MSYLDFPRLHFSGLFYTGPGTINNTTDNYIPNVPLTNPPPPPDQYNSEVAGWNPVGVSQWWLEECSVLSAVGTGGVEVDASDAVIGALVQSPSPKTPMSDGQGGFYDIAKMVDLDPDQQFRSALYGLRIFITLPNSNGAGLQGLLTISELRQLNGRIAGAQSSWGAVGNWMGTLQNVQRSGDISGSPLLTALYAASGAQGLAVKLTADLHQNNPANVFTSGDMFLYGRILGSIGPALAGELAQVVPGRCLQRVSPAATTAALDAAMQPGKRVLQGRERVAAQTVALGAIRAARNADDASAAAPPDPWNPAFAVIRKAGSQSLLSIDIGGSILLNSTQDPNDPNGLVSDGTFEVDSGIDLGVWDNANSGFVPFANGNITFASQYQPLESTSKNCTLVGNSGVFTIQLTEDEANFCQTNPLAIQVNGTTVAQENTNGLWADVSVSSQRLECGGNQPGTAQIMLRVFGNPLDKQTPPVEVSVQLFQWSLQDNNWTNTLSPSTDVGLVIGKKTDNNGLADISVVVNPNVTNLNLPAIRQPLDSQVYYIFLTDSSGNVIGDGPGGNATISVLLWNAFTPPSNPTWDEDISPVFNAYARLYPGMKARLDISDEATVKGFASGILNNHMDVPITDPAYMPVTRDLSPSKMKMIVKWLKQVSQQAATPNAQPEVKS